MKIPHLSKLLSVFILCIATVSAAVAGGPAAPTPLSPAGGASLLEPLTISWSAVTDPSGIIGYNWQVSTSSNFSTVALQSSTNVGQTQDTVSGLPNGTYYWHVQAVNGAFVQGTWSTTRSFNVTGAGPGQPGSPTLAPTKGYSTFHPREVITFNWTVVSGATSYVLQASTDPSFPPTSTATFNNIPDTTFSFATPDEGFYSARVFAVNSNGISGVPSNVITYSVFYNNPLPNPPSPIAPANGGILTLPITLTRSDVPNPQPSGYELQIAKDSSFSTIEEDAPQLNNANRTVLSLTPGTKYWRIRSSQGDSSPTTAALTKWSASGTFTVNQAPASPVSITPVSNPIYSGDSTLVAIQLSAAAPSNGAVISLSSSDPNAAPVPATVTMPANTAWMQFTMKVGQVTASTPVTLTATMNSGTASVQLTVLPPSLKSLTISPGTISGGAEPQVIAMLNGQAPAGGAAINFTSDSPAALPPAVATVAAGNASVSFAMPTNTVSTTTTATITADWNGVTAQAPVTLTPLGQPASITLSSTSVTGTTGSFATVTIAAPASFDQIFQVTSSNPAATVPSSVLIPAGSTIGGFIISTTTVSTQTTVTISVSGGGVTRSASLTLNAVSAPPPATTATLTVTAGGRSGERVTSNPVGISVAVGSTGSASFNSGTSITLSVSNGRDAIWSGACSSGGNKAKTCTFTLTADASVSVNVQ
ncbi:MAG TPA: hypothetical protein VLT16_12905 [Candidatus Limnocylindrales bacterium]|nr:hypothetical protein [Candidatus Limnocylindrales bacterium]